MQSLETICSHFLVLIWCPILLSRVNFSCLPLSSLCRYNSVLLRYFGSENSCSLQTDIWFDWKHVNPTIKAFNLTSSLTHCRPINPILNPKASSPPFCGQCATHRHKSLSSASFSPRPHSIVHVSLQGWIWVQPQLASLGYDLFCCEGCTCTKYLDKGHTSIKQNSAAYWSDVIVIANSAVLLLVKDITERHLIFGRSSRLRSRRESVLNQTLENTGHNRTSGSHENSAKGWYEI